MIKENGLKMLISLFFLLMFHDLLVHSEEIGGVIHPAIEAGVHGADQLERWKL